MAIPFNIPEEQSDSDLILNQRLLDLYNLLYQILLQHEPNHTTVTETVAESVVSEIEPLPFILEYETRKRKKVREYSKAAWQQPVDIADTVYDRLVAPSSHTIYHDWIQIGRNLRQIADNFHFYHSSEQSPRVQCVEMTSSYTEYSDLLTTIVSMSPFRDSIWCAVLVVGCRILTSSR